MTTGELKHKWEKNDAITWLRLIAGHLAKIDRSLTGICSQVSQFKEEKGNLPPTPPIKKKEEACVCTPRAREGSSCGRAPTLDEVKGFASGHGIAEETAVDFWDNCEAFGWRWRGQAIVNWKRLLQSWQRARNSLAQAAARKEAHIDAKMDERERRRSAPRRPDNWIPATENQITDFCDVFKG